MGVDTSVSVVVGFVIDPEAFETWRATVPDQENYGDEELMEKLLGGNADGLIFGTAGSYYSSDEPITQWVGIERLTTSHNTDDIPGGVIGLSKPTITLAEREALNRVAAQVGVAEPIIGQFMSVLWY